MYRAKHPYRAFLKPAMLTLFSLFLGSCDPDISFKEPQPRDAKSLPDFPKSIQGDYANQKDHSILSILDKEIRRTYVWDEKESIRDLDSNYRLRDSNLVSLDGKEKIPVYVIGDSFSMKNKFYVDTLFKISENSVLKKFKGNYFLNQRKQENLWTVTRLSLKKGILSTGSITMDNIKKLQEIAETTDTTSFEFELTPQQFKKFIREEGFIDTETFLRIKK